LSKKKSPKGEANPQYKPYLPSGAEKVACHLRTKKLPAAGRRRLPAKQSRICERSHCCFFLFFLWRCIAVALCLLCFPFHLPRCHVFTEIRYPNTPKFHNPIPNTDSSFTNPHKSKSRANRTHTTEFFSTCFNHPHLPTHSYL
jgi:hypothetical protein